VIRVPGRGPWHSWPRKKAFPGRISDTLHHLLGELVAREAAAVECFPDNLPYVLGLGGVERRVERAARVAPGSALSDCPRTARRAAAEG
jgi:hypothetical protein